MSAGRGLEPEHPGLAGLLCQPQVVQPRNPVRCSRPVHSALGDQKVEVRMEVDPVPKGLDGRDDARDEILPRQGLEVDRKGFDR